MIVLLAVQWAGLQEGGTSEDSFHYLSFYFHKSQFQSFNLDCTHVVLQNLQMLSQMLWPTLCRQLLIESSLHLQKFETFV